jgi:hypothetical protein
MPRQPRGVSRRGSATLPEPPEWFNDAHRKVWFDTLPDVPRNLLYRIDIQAFATYVELIVRHREAVLTQR